MIFSELIIHFTPISVDRVSFSAPVFEANESDAGLVVALELERPENIIHEVTVTVSTMEISGSDSAKGTYVHMFSSKTYA